MISTMSCPPGYTRRKSYTRTFTSSVARSGYTVHRKGKLFMVHPKKSAVYVPSQCVKTPAKRHSLRIGKLRKGDLIKYGYQYRLADRLRHIALNKAIKVYGINNVYHKLDAIAKLSVRVASDAHKIFVKDREWVHNQM